MKVEVHDIISIFKRDLALYTCQKDFFVLKIFRIDYENNKCYNIKNFILFYGGGIMKKNILRSLLLVIVFLFAISCGKKNDTIKIVFLPNETNDSLKKSREEFARIVQEATGKKVEIVTTTDYNITVENIVSGQSQIAYIGAEAYLNARKRTKDIEAVLTNSGESGTLKDALYYSFIAVRGEDADKYRSGNGFDLKKIKGKSIGFVTNSSTSGFKVPGEVIVKEFGLKNTDELLGNKVFSKVMFGNSHPGTQVLLFKGDVDVATFAIPKSFTIYELVAGKDFNSGATYKVKKGAVAPFGEFAGKSFTVIKSIPVYNGPIVFNTRTLSKEDQEKIKKALMAKSTTDNPNIFSNKKSKVRGLFLKENDNVGFVETNTAWYEGMKNIK